MSKEYQQFPISNFRTGFNESVEPWLLPRDAYQVMVNAHLYRGVLEKTLGYIKFADMSYRTITTLTNSTGNTWIGTIANVPITTTNIQGYGQITSTTAETFTYFSDGVSPVVNLKGSALGTGTLNVTTGAISFTFHQPVTYAFVMTDSVVNADPTMRTAIMGIKQYYKSDGSQEVIVFDEKRVGKIVPISGFVGSTVSANNGISEIPHAYYYTAKITSDGMTLTYTGTLTNVPIVPGTVTFFQFDVDGNQVFIDEDGLSVPGNITDNGTGALRYQNVTIGNINYATGAFSVTFSVAPPNNNYFDATSGFYGNVFTGNFSNFFTTINYQYKLFLTNNVDPIFYYDGNLLQYLNTSLEAQNVTATLGVPTNFDITRTLHVFAYRERLLLISPTVIIPMVGSVPQNSAIYWSVLGNPLVFTNDEQLFPSTSEPIRTFGYINTDLIVRFASSERVFRYTGDASSPFRWDSTNNLWDCDSNYGEINYDTWFSTVGKPGIVGSDGVNVKRSDELIPDFTDPTRLSQEVPVPFMSQTSIGQCYGERFDDLKEGWMCYNSSPTAEAEIQPSNYVLAFNYLDSTYAIYSFPLSSLGFGKINNVPTWGTTYTKWGNMSDAWGSYQLQNNALLDLGGDQYDTVWELNNGNVQTIAGDSTQALTPVLFNVISKNFNPFIEEGQLARLGYIDLFVTADIDSTLRVQFYVNDQLWIDAAGNPQGFYQETTLTFNTTDSMSPTTNQSKVWKRIYVGAIGKSHTIRFYQNIDDFGTTNDQPIFVHSMILWMKPAGRIFQ